MSSIPRSSTELFPESMRLSPKQREVLNTLQQFPQGAKAAEVAHALGMHVNTARGHLDELVTVGAVRVITAPAHGRGRPSLIFQVRVPDNQSIAEEYISLINLLASMLVTEKELDDYSSAQARTIGRQWAKLTHAGKATDDSPLAFLFRRMRDMGFDPTINDSEFSATGTADLLLHACPFVTAGVSPSPFVCAVHDGYLEHVAHISTDGKIMLKLEPKAGNGVCRVDIQATPEA